MFIDEAANLPSNPNIKKWLELARSRGARSVIGTQSVSQLIDLYGVHSTDAMLNLLSIAVVLRMGAVGDDAEYTAKIFGNRIIERPTSIEPQPSWNRVAEPLVEAFELVQLNIADDQGVQGFLFIPGWNGIYKLTWPIFSRAGVAEAHSAAAWINETDEKPTKNNNRLRKGDYHVNDKPD